MWREHCYRQLYPMTHEQFLDEPALLVDWCLAMRIVENEVAEDAAKKQR